MSEKLVIKSGRATYREIAHGCDFCCCLQTRYVRKGVYVLKGVCRLSRRRRGTVTVGSVIKEWWSNLGGKSERVCVVNFAHVWSRMCVNERRDWQVKDSLSVWAHSEGRSKNGEVKQWQEGRKER